MVVVAQLVRALDCGSRGRGFKSRLPPYLRSLRSVSMAGRSGLAEVVLAYEQSENRQYFSFHNHVLPRIYSLF